jgi:hypothetical protein
MPMMLNVPLVRAATALALGAAGGAHRRTLPGHDRGLCRPVDGQAGVIGAAPPPDRSPSCFRRRRSGVAGQPQQPPPQQPPPPCGGAVAPPVMATVDSSFTVSS